MSTKTYEDKALTCCDCQKEFIFTSGEQEFFDKKGFTQIPKRCTDCRANKKAQITLKDGQRDHSSVREYKRSAPKSSFEKFPAICTECGTKFDAPFEPKEGRPVFCRDCYQKRRP